MKRKICFIILLFTVFTAQNVMAFDVQTVLSNVGFNIFSQKDAKEEITKVLDKQQNYTNKKNYEKLKALYTRTYANFDGIDIDSYIESLKKTSDLHGKLTYKTTINQITINGDYATVDATDTADGVTKDSYEIIPGKGILHSEAKVLYYFKKEDGIWKINSETALSEKSFLKYGSAKEVEFILNAPECVKADTEYNVKITVDSPNSRGLIASLTTEIIQYPHVKSEDVFRAMKKDGELERVVTSNNEGKNEIAFASVAVAKPVLNNESKIDFAIDGIAFISSRVNVIPNMPKKSEKINEQKK